WAAAREVFPEAEVHILADSGPPIDVGEDLLGAFNSEWRLQHPAGCSTCAERQLDILPFIAAASPTTRMGLLTYGTDPVLADYAALDADAFEVRLRAVVDVLEQAGGKVFMVAGASHVVVANP